MRTPTKLLVIDDSPETHEMVELLFDQTREVRPVLLHAYNGRDGLDLVASNLDLDVIVLDLSMPVMDGFEVLTRLRAGRRSAGIPVLVFSGNRQDSTKALSLGARDFVNKPGNYQEILLRLENLVEAKYQAEASERAKLDFLSVVSHELRTPMNGILGMVEALRDGGMTPDQETFLGALDDSARRMMGLVDNVLRYLESESPSQTLPRAPFDPCRVVQDVLAEFTPEAERTGVALGTRTRAGGFPEVDGWEAMARTALHHLVGNAVKFAPGGRVAVDLEFRPGAGGAGQVLFSVSDTGPGFPSDRKEDLFRALTQGDSSGTRRFGGLGIGLAIASRLVQQMGSSLEVESSPGSGSVFRFALSVPV